MIQKASAFQLNDNGKVSVNQIEGFEDILAKLEKLDSFTASDYRRVIDYILLSDLEPNISDKIDFLSENYDLLQSLAKGVEYNGNYYPTMDVLKTVLDSEPAWIEDKYTEVEKI
jgi:hypothetical protein